MVLKDLGKKITGALKKLSEVPVIDEEVLKELLKEIGNALMQACASMMNARLNHLSGRRPHLHGDGAPQVHQESDRHGDDGCWL